MTDKNQKFDISNNKNDDPFVELARLLKAKKMENASFKKNNEAPFPFAKKSPEAPHSNIQNIDTELEQNLEETLGFQERAQAENKQPFQQNFTDDKIFSDINLPFTNTPRKKPYQNEDITDNLYNDLLADLEQANLQEELSYNPSTPSLDEEELIISPSDTPSFEENDLEDFMNKAFFLNTESSQEDLRPNIPAVSSAENINSTQSTSFTLSQKEAQNNLFVKAPTFPEAIVADAPIATTNSVPFPSLSEGTEHVIKEKPPSSPKVEATPHTIADNSDRIISEIAHDDKTPDVDTFSFENEAIVPVPAFIPEEELSETQFKDEKDKIESEAPDFEAALQQTLNDVFETRPANYGKAFAEQIPQWDIEKPSSEKKQENNLSTKEKKENDWDFGNLDDEIPFNDNFETNGKNTAKKKQTSIILGSLLTFFVITTAIYFYFRNDDSHTAPAIIYADRGPYKIAVSRDDDSQGIPDIVTYEHVAGEKAAQKIQKELIDDTEEPKLEQTLTQNHGKITPEDNNLDGPSASEEKYKPSGETSIQKAPPKTSVEGKAEQQNQQEENVKVLKPVQETEKEEHQHIAKDNEAETTTEAKVTPAPVPTEKPKKAETPTSKKTTIEPRKEAATHKVNEPHKTATTKANFYVQLASLPEKEKAKETLNNLTKKYESFLTGVKITIQEATIPGRGTFYRLRVPFETRDAAKEFSQKVKDAGGSYFITH